MLSRADEMSSYRELVRSASGGDVINTIVVSFPAAGVEISNRRLKPLRVSELVHPYEVKTVYP